MELETFAQRVRLGGSDCFVLWQSAFEFGVENRVLRDAGGRIPTFSAPEAARTYAAGQGIALSSYPPGIDPTEDLDAVARWAACPQAPTLNPTAVVYAWMFLDDAGVLPGMYDDDIGTELEHVVSQLDSADLAVRYPDQFARFAPAWTAGELATLAVTLQRGIAEFSRLIALSDSV